MNRQLFILGIIMACLASTSYAITCYVCVLTGCDDPFKYNGDTSDVFKYTYNSSFIACGKIILNDGSGVVRGGITVYYGPTWKANAGTVYACQNDICNGAFRIQSTSSVLLLFVSLFGSFLIQKHLI